MPEQDSERFECFICHAQFDNKEMALEHMKGCLSPEPRNNGETLEDPAPSSELPAGGDQATTRSASSRKSTPFQKPETISIIEAGRKELLIGHGLHSRTTSSLDDPVKAILEKQYQKGIAKASNRKGVLEMVEACEKVLPLLLRPDVHEVNSWLSSRLKQDKASSTSSDDKRESANRTLREKRQHDASVLKREQSMAARDDSKYHLFLAKYRDVLLLKGNDVMIVTDVKFDQVGKVWKVVAKRAVQNKYDDREYLPNPDDNAGSSISILGRKESAGSLIKAFNSRK